MLGECIMVNMKVLKEKKLYEAPQMETMSFSVEDIITMSGIFGGGGDEIIGGGGGTILPPISNGGGYGGGDY